MLTRRDCWLVAGGFLAIVLLWILFPRYEWREIETRYGPQAWLRIDRWTGQATIGLLDRRWGRWVSMAELQHDAEQKGVEPAGRGTISERLAEIDKMIAESPSKK